MNIRTFLIKIKKIPYRISVVFLITVLFVVPLPVGSNVNFFNEITSDYPAAITNKVIPSAFLAIESIRSIVSLSNEYNVDYRLIVAIIKHESQFDDKAISERGASGLMQIMPTTHNEILEQLSIDSISLLKDHLKVGIYYFSKLLSLFENCSEEDKICFALASYNAGPSRVYDAQELAAYLGEVPTKWCSVRNALPFLSRRYYSLHNLVWNGNKPPNGYYGSWRQTIKYVENVIRTYNEYKELAS